MGRRGRRVVTCVVVALVVVTVAALLFWRPVGLYWAKRKAWKIADNLTPANRAAMNAVPVMLKLPPAGEVELETFKIEGFLVRVPRPDSTKQNSSTPLGLTYPRYKVFFLRPFSIAAVDMLMKSSEHRTYFESEEACYRARLDDIDKQVDLDSLSKYLTLLSEKMKSCGARLDIYFAEFKEADRQGFIMPLDPGKHELHVVIIMRGNELSVGMLFESERGVDPADVLEFLGKMQLEADPAATLPRK